MAEIAPFRGVLYDTARVDASRVLAPPYDVIDDADRARLAELDPHNCVRLILPDGEGDAKYPVAAAALEAWMGEGVLAQDDRPALYRYNQVFTSPELGPDPVTRRGFIAAVRLHRFDERVILPHERTLKGPKIDRLKLMTACEAHFSQIFTLYSDPACAVDEVFAPFEARDPVIDGTTADGTQHLLWRVDDEAAIARVAQLLAAESLYIADGHHRYETMLALRDQLGERAAFGTLFLANMSDPGLVVLPIHRLVHSVAGFSAAQIKAAAAEWFEVREVPGAAADADRVRGALADAGARGPTFAMVVPGSRDATLLTVKPGVALDGPPSLATLDVSYLHTLVLERLLGIDRAALEAQTNITYVKDTQKTLDLLAAGEGQCAFLMNSTRAEQVRDVADAGECMPQKSTFFYPKIASGIVIRVL